MDESRHRLFDTVIKVVTAIVALCVAIIGLMQYREVSRNNIENQKIERYKLLITESKENITTLQETITTVRRLRVQSNQEGRFKIVPQEAIDKFWQLYEIDLIGLENPRLEKAMIDLGAMMNRREEGLPDAILEVIDACSLQIANIKNEVQANKDQILKLKASTDSPSPDKTKFLSQP